MAHEGLEIGKDGTCAEGKRAPCFGGWGLVGDKRCSTHRGARISAATGRCQVAQQRVLLEATEEMRDKLAEMAAKLSDEERAIFASAQREPSLVLCRWIDASDVVSVIEMELAAMRGVAPPSWVETRLSVAPSWRHAVVWPHGDKRFAAPLVVEAIEPVQAEVPTVKLTFTNRIALWRAAP